MKDFKYRIVEIKKKLVNGKEEYEWRLQKKNFFGIWNDAKHNSFLKSGTGSVFIFLKDDAMEFYTKDQAVSYLKELKKLDDFKQAHKGKLPFYVFGTYDYEGKHIVAYAVLNSMKSFTDREYIVSDRFYISHSRIKQTREDLIDEIKSLAGKIIKETDYNYIYLDY